MEKVKEVLHKATAPKGSTTHTTGTTHDTHGNTGLGGQHTGTTGTAIGSGNHSSGLTGSHQTGYGSTNAGPHDSNLMNAADPRVDSDRSHERHGQTSGLTGSHGSTNAGPHNSNMMNAADPRVDSDRSQQGYGQTSGLTGSHGSTNAGPHNSNLMNAADPRVDSDRSQQGYGQTSGLTGSHGSTNAGPHNSNLMNAADPRVDSDRSQQGYGQTSGLTGSHNSHSTGGGYGTSTGSTNAGPHSSNLANKLDPRVDSDRDGQGKLQSAVPGSTGHNSGTGMGSHQQHTGVGGAYGTSGSTNAGPHDSNLMNAADPRVDSDRSNYGNTSSGISGSHQAGLGSHQQHGVTGGHQQGQYVPSDIARDGPAPHTAGPHKSDMLNKVDPRIDSDHSKTTGHNQQY